MIFLLLNCRGEASDFLGTRSPTPSQVWEFVVLINPRKSDSETYKLFLSSPALLPSEQAVLGLPGLQQRVRKSAWGEHGRMLALLTTPYYSSPVVFIWIAHGGRNTRSLTERSARGKMGRKGRVSPLSSFPSPLMLSLSLKWVRAWETTWGRAKLICCLLRT